ncbi:MAG: UvrD-helicase domain-containing protein [Ignavibacteria bacterium]|nr:UvrD-helicase domain-containing protein [Ignavibacteria bacterium]
MKTTSNPQDTLAESLNGIYLVDAGAGTGKTHTIIRRYQNIIESGVSPADILLITFTRNAADQLKESAMVNISEKVNITEILEAPILNFHALCARILKNSGSKSAKYLGIDEEVTSNFTIIENFGFENEVFRKFFLMFKNKTYDKYEEIYLGLNNKHEAVLRIIKFLATRGIFPTKDGWFNEAGNLFNGRMEDYNLRFDELNEPAFVKNDKSGTKEKQNDFYKKIRDAASRSFYLSFDINSLLTENRVNPEYKEEIFNDDTQSLLIEFTRDIYWSYIEFMLKKNYLNFEFIVMLAFLTLYYDEKVRNHYQYEYSMVDEFQDTDEIQFQLLMLMIKDSGGKANLAVVGDWKQGIFGFRNTTIENIMEFENRLKKYKGLLNKDKSRITYDVDNVNKISFEYNYRSSQTILNFSKETLKTEAKKDEQADFETTEQRFGQILKARRELDDLTDIQFYQSEESEKAEIDIVFRKISELINEKKYVCREFDKEGKVKDERPLRYSDICVLSRTNNFCLKLQKEGLQRNIPVNFGGWLELFSSDQAILVLAWLRLMMNENNAEALVPILEKEEYNFPEIRKIISGLKDKATLFTNIPEDIIKFRNRLCGIKENLLRVTETILNRYGFNNNVSSALLNEIDGWIKTDLISLGELIRLIDSSKKDTYEIDINRTREAVITQTVHSAKGLEYPVIILSNMNQSLFPNTRSNTNEIFYLPVPGLRFRKKFETKDDYSLICNNWKSDVLIKMFKPDNYDEERRLLYVAVTRAKQYLYFTSFRPSQFFKHLAELTGKEPIKDFQYEVVAKKKKIINLTETVPAPQLIKPSPEFHSVHDLMNEKITGASDISEAKAVYRASTEAMDHGVMIHQLAHRLANKVKVDSDNEEIKKLKKFISKLRANKLRTEVDFLYPKDDKVIRGTIDLIAFYDDRIEVIDYKTDRNKKYLEKYKIQVGIYKDVIKNIYKDKAVTGKIYFIGLDEVLSV